MNWSKDTWMLIFAAAIAILFFVAGVFDVLDYLIIKFLLWGSFSVMFAFIIYMFVKDFEQKKSP